MSKLMNQILFWVIILFNSNPIDSLAKDQTTCDGYQKADKELNLVYQKILNDKEYKNKKEFIAALKKAQEAWLIYRDASLEAMYPGKDKQGEYGTVFPTCSCSFLLERTQKRIQELTLWTKGLEEGDVCSGSVKFK